MKFSKLVKKELQKHAGPERAKASQRFFKTGPGEYGEGDKFIGVAVPDQRKVAKKFYKGESVEAIVSVLKDPVHEMRLTALFMLVSKFKQVRSEEGKQEIVNAYLANTKYVNNWDLVDSSAHKILGPWLESRDRSILYQLADSKNLWEQRIAILTTMHFVKTGDLDDLYAISLKLLDHEHDLIHKAVGWLLREAGKQDEGRLHRFLKKHYKRMPRTMLRYAIEKFDKPTRHSYLQG